jgi:hypothetical protein
VRSHHQCCGSGIFISGSQIRIHNKELKHF